ncbi:MAG TPA: MBL fold metallo-hydrolase [Actinomycetota bacterium]|jgi:ribonuclease BN (tRNA processing enzyme)
MDLTILGACGTWPKAGGACSGYLVRHEGFTVWVDMGAGTLANAQEHTDLLDVDAVIVSHSHADHIVDLFPYFYARHYALGGPKGTPLFWPPGVYARVGGLLSEESLGDLATSFLLHDVEPGTEFEIGPFRVTTAPMAHPVPTLGIRMEAGGNVLAYTADSGPTPEVVKLSREADLMLADATWQSGTDASYPPDIHMTDREAGQAAREAEVHSLVLTHIWPSLDLRVSEEQAAREYQGPVTLAREGMHLAVGE